MLRYVVTSLTLLWTCQAQFPRAVTETLRVANGGQYGRWTSDEFCPPHQFAVGYDMKIEDHLGWQSSDKDDTSLNAIALLCSDIEGRHYGEKSVTSGEGQFGAWIGRVTCNQPIVTDAFLTAFDLDVQGPQGRYDDTAAGWVKFKCTNMTDDSVQELNKDPGQSFVGAWEAGARSVPMVRTTWFTKSHKIGTHGKQESQCGPVSLTWESKGSAICGLKTRIEPNQGSGDDTGLNDVIFYCCSVAEGGAIVGK